MGTKKNHQNIWVRSYLGKEFETIVERTRNLLDQEDLEERIKISVIKHTGTSTKISRVDIQDILNIHPCKIYLWHTLEQVYDRTSKIDEVVYTKFRFINYTIIDTVKYNTNLIIKDNTITTNTTILTLKETWLLIMTHRLLVLS